jgi:hypothetical protein
MGRPKVIKQRIVLRIYGFAKDVWTRRDELKAWAMIVILVMITLFVAIASFSDVLDGYAPDLDSGQTYEARQMHRQQQKDRASKLPPGEKPR